MSKIDIGPFAWIIPVAAALNAAVAVIHSRRHVYPFAIFIGFWYVFARSMSQQGFFESKETWDEVSLADFAVFGGLPFVPLAIAFAALFSSTELQTYLYERVTIWGLMAVQTYRLNGGVFLYLHLTRGMASWFSLQTGVLGTLIGATALPVALYVKNRGVLHSKSLILGWNLLGLLDLVGAFGMVAADFIGIVKLDIIPSVLGAHPFGFIVFFNAIVAIGVHMLILTKIDKFGRREKTD